MGSQMGRVHHEVVEDVQLGIDFGAQILDIPFIDKVSLHVNI